MSSSFGVTDSMKKLITEVEKFNTSVGPLVRVHVPRHTPLSLLELCKEFFRVYTSKEQVARASYELFKQVHSIKKMELSKMIFPDSFDFILLKMLQGIGFGEEISTELSEVLGRSYEQAYANQSATSHDKFYTRLCGNVVESQKELKLKISIKNTYTLAVALIAVDFLCSSHLVQYENDANIFNERLNSAEFLSAKETLGICWEMAIRSSQKRSNQASQMIISATRDQLVPAMRSVRKIKPKEIYIEVISVINSLFNGQAEYAIDLLKQLTAESRRFLVGDSVQSQSKWMLKRIEEDSRLLPTYLIALALQI